MLNFGVVTDMAAMCNSSCRANPYWVLHLWRHDASQTVKYPGPLFCGNLMFSVHGNTIVVLATGSSHEFRIFFMYDQRSGDTTVAIRSMPAFAMSKSRGRLTHIIPCAIVCYCMRPDFILATCTVGRSVTYVHNI